MTLLSYINVKEDREMTEREEKFEAFVEGDLSNNRGLIINNYREVCTIWIRLRNIQPQPFDFGLSVKK